MRAPRRWLSGVVSVLLLMSALPATGQAVLPLQVPDDGGFSPEAKTYIVWMAEDPVVAYEGDVAGLAATSPDDGSRMDPEQPAVQDYREYLRSRHDAVLAAAGAPDAKTVDYGIAFNGFAAVLTGPQAEALSRQPGVVHLFENVKHRMDTVTTPDFLGLTAPGGAWSQRFWGDGLVVGVVDSGIVPESASFADSTLNPDGRGRTRFERLRDWRGRCDTGERFRRNDCNNKIVAARFYYSGFGTAEELKALIPYELISARDVDGHGSHTASTAAGNFGVRVRLGSTNVGGISGMAPLARIAVYKACWGVSGPQ